MTTFGKFVHYDLMTLDHQRARAFYTELFGWTIKEYDMGGGGVYQMLEVNGQGFGGIESLPAESGVPSHWIAYISVDDVAQTCEAATKKGAKVHVQPTPIPGVGTFAVVEDPQGAVFSPFAGADPTREMPPKPTGPGAIIWHELATSDPAAALAFYAELFGWSAGQSMPMGEAGSYQMIRHDGSDIAGLMPLPDPGIPRPYWLQYVHVASADDTTRRAVAMGGQVLHGPSDLPGTMGRIAVLQGPTGAWLGIWQPGAES